MKTRHRLSMQAMCPVDSHIDNYIVDVFVQGRLLQCETILEAISEATGVRAFQEELTQELANILECTVQTTGLHCQGRVETICQCEPRRPGEAK